MNINIYNLLKKGLKEEIFYLGMSSDLFFELLSQKNCEDFEIYSEDEESFFVDYSYFDLYFERKKLIYVKLKLSEIEETVCYILSSKYYAFEFSRFIDLELLITSLNKLDIKYKIFKDKYPECVSIETEGGWEIIISFEEYENGELVYLMSLPFKGILIN